MNRIAAAAALMLVMVSSAGAQDMKVDFDGRTSKSPEYAPAFKPLSIAAAPATASARPGASSPVRFAIRDGFYGPGSMAAFDQQGAVRVRAFRSAGGWRTEVDRGGVREKGKVAVSEGKRYSYASGGASLSLEFKDGAYALSRGAAALKALDHGPAFALKSGAADLAFRQAAVTGETDQPRLSAELTALYLVMLGEAGRGGAVSKSTDIDENGGGWTSCSDTSQSWTIDDVEYRTTSHQRQEIYVCKFVVTWSCRWRSCQEVYPHTQPGQCYCKSACSKSARNTGECAWQPVSSEE